MVTSNVRTKPQAKTTSREVTASVVLALSRAERARRCPLIEGPEHNSGKQPGSKAYRRRETSSAGIEHYYRGCRDEYQTCQWPRGEQPTSAQSRYARPSGIAHRPSREEECADDQK